MTLLLLLLKKRSGTAKMYYQHFLNGRAARSFPERIIRSSRFYISSPHPWNRPSSFARTTLSRSFPPGRDVLQLPAFRDVDDGRIEQLLGVALDVVTAVLQGLVKGVRRRGIALETEVPAWYRHDEQAEQKPEDVADDDVPPVMPVVAHSGQRAQYGPHPHQALQPRFQKQRPIRQTVLQVPLCAMQKANTFFLQNEITRLSHCILRDKFYFSHSFWQRFLFGDEKGTRRTDS